MADNKGGASEAALGWGILLCVFAAIGYLVWWMFSDQIRNIIRWIRYGEMWIASWFLPSDYTVEWQGQDVNYHELMNAVKVAPPSSVDGTFMDLVSTVTFAPYILPICALTACFGFWSLFRGPGTEHRTQFDLDGLIRKQANMFPIITPFIDFNPASMPARAPGSPVPAELPPFAEALSPEEWIVYNEIPVLGKKLDEEASNKAFAKQLGARWRGAKHLEPYKQIMLAAFCLKAARRRADSDVMMGRLAQCWTFKGGLKIDGKLLREARSVLANASIAGSTLKKCNEHAWETTAMMRGLLTAREEGGVLAPAQFVWLRSHNRALWYPLNNMGRQSLHMEAMGAMAHFKAEKLASRPIPRPKVNDATLSLMEYMESLNARPLPQLDFSNSKKRGIKKPKAA